MVDAMHRSPSFALKGHIQRGDTAPWWNQGRYRFVFDAVAGRYIVLTFYRSAGDAVGQTALRALNDHGHFVRDGKACFFGVSADQQDQADGGVEAKFPSIQFLWDADATLNAAYGIGASRLTILLDPTLRVLEVIPFRSDGLHWQQLFDLLDALPPPSRFLGFEMPAPVLILPNVFEPELCRHLIDQYEKHGGRESGYMQEVSGETVEVYDHAWKRRRDYIISDGPLTEQIDARVSRRIGPVMRKAFHFKVTRMERHLVACYSSEDGGHFGAHRDDTVKATQHRRFAVSINLNDDFAGGELSFPEFGPRGYKAPVGTAVIFSASLLHAVGTVTGGRRYAFLPFLHDEEAEQIRVANCRTSPKPA